MLQLKCRSYVTTSVYFISLALTRLAEHAAERCMYDSMQRELLVAKEKRTVYDYGRLRKVHPKQASRCMLKPRKLISSEWLIGIYRDGYPGTTPKDFERQSVCTGDDGLLLKINERCTGV